jgi:hypothetical protein
MATDLQEALTAAGAAALVQKQIDPVLLEYQRRYAPLVRALPSTKWGSTVYYFNKRTTLPSGGFVTDGGARAVSTSNYAQENFQIRLLHSVGAVTGYSQAVTQDLIGDLRAREIEGAARGLYWDIENALIWGAEAPTTAGPYPQFDGLDVICSAFSNASSGGPNTGVGGGSIDNYGGASGTNGWGAPNYTPWTTYNPWTSGVDQNAIDFGGSSLTLGGLDLLIDLVESNVAEPVESSEWMFLMSPSAVSRLSQLLINQQRFVDKVEIAPGLIVQTYRGVPIVKSSFLSPRTNKMGTVTVTATAGTGLTSGTTYNYRVAPVIARFGEIQASTVAPVTPSSTNLQATLTFSTPTGPEGSQPTHYKVYRDNTVTGSLTTVTLLGIVDASYLDSSGNIWPVTQVVDNGGKLVISDGTHAASNQPTSYTYGNPGLKPLTANGEQSIYLMSRDPNYITRPYVREMQPVNVFPTTASPDSLPFAFVADTTLAVRAPKYIGRLANVASALDKNSGWGGVYTTGYAASSAITGIPTGPSFIVD